MLSNRKSYKYSSLLLSIICHIKSNYVEFKFNNLDRFIPMSIKRSNRYGVKKIGVV